MQQTTKKLNIETFKRFVQYVCEQFFRTQVDRVKPAQSGSDDDDDEVCYGTKRHCDGVESSCVSYVPPKKVVTVEEFPTAHVAERAALKTRRECECVTREERTAQVGERCPGLDYLPRCVQALRSKNKKEEGGILGKGQSAVCAACRTFHAEKMKGTRCAAKRREEIEKKFDGVQYDNAKFKKKLPPRMVPGIERRKVKSWYTDGPVCGLCSAVVVTPWEQVTCSAKVPDGGDFAENANLREKLHEECFLSTSLKDLRQFSRGSIATVMQQAQQAADEEAGAVAVRLLNVCNECSTRLLKSITAALGVLFGQVSCIEALHQGPSAFFRRNEKLLTMVMNNIARGFQTPVSNVVPMERDRLWTDEDRRNFCSGFRLPRQVPIRLVFLWTRTSNRTWHKDYVPTFVYDFDLAAHLARKKYEGKKAAVFPGQNDSDRTYDTYIIPELYGKRGSFQSSLCYSNVQVKRKSGSALAKSNLRPTFCDLVADVNLALETLHPATQVSILIDSCADLTGNFVNLLCSLRMILDPSRVFFVPKRTTVGTTVKSVSTVNVRDIIFVLENRIDKPNLFAIPETMKLYDPTLETVAFFVRGFVFELCKPLRNAMQTGHAPGAKSRKISAVQHESLSENETIPSQAAEVTLSPHSDEGLEALDELGRTRSSRSTTWLCSWQKASLRRLEVNVDTPREYFTRESLSHINRRCNVDWSNRIEKKRTQVTEGADEDERVPKKARTVHFSPTNLSLPQCHSEEQSDGEDVVLPVDTDMNECVGRGLPDEDWGDDEDWWDGVAEKVFGQSKEEEATERIGYGPADAWNRIE